MTEGLVSIIKEAIWGVGGNTSAEEQGRESVPGL